MSKFVDASVYPDDLPPEEFLTVTQKCDYLHRVISAFDFGLPPEEETLRLLSGWREVFDEFPLSGSPGYHALRAYFGWDAVKKDPFPFAPAYYMQDARENRQDGYEDRV